MLVRGFPSFVLRKEVKNHQISLRLFTSLETNQERNSFYLKVVQELTNDVVSTVGTGVMLEQPGVDTFLMKSVSTGDNTQLLQEEQKQDLSLSKCILTLINNLFKTS